MKHMVNGGAIGLPCWRMPAGRCCLLLMRKKELALIAGGSTVEVSMLGNGFEDPFRRGTHPKWWSDGRDARGTEADRESNRRKSGRSRRGPVRRTCAQEPSEMTPTEGTSYSREEMPASQVEEADVIASIAPVETVIPQEDGP